MLQAQITAPVNALLSEDQVRSAVAEGLEHRFTNQRVLVLIPDHTRSLPLPFLFRILVETLHDTRQLDFMVALGTHPPLDPGSLNRLVGISASERAGRFRHFGLHNHAWNDPSALAVIGVMEQDEIRMLAGSRWYESLPDRVEIQINRAALEYDHILILGPTFPHEVVGFSGGAKYLFPGISGADMVNATHWLGALAGVVHTIGEKDTPVRAMIRAGAVRLPTPVTLAALTVKDDGLAGIFIGDLEAAWNAAADLSARVHVRWCDRPFQRVLSCPPPMYDELWTAAKAMYKLEPAVAAGGEVVIYAPHLDTVSQVHGDSIFRVGYHILPYFLEHWSRFREEPLMVMAHSSHLRGSGEMEGGKEKPNVRVTLASRISREDCSRLNLGYLDPGSIRMEDWQGREDEGILCVPKAGEILHKVR